MHIGDVMQNEYGDVFFSHVNEESFSNQSAYTLFERYVFPLLTKKDSVYLIIGTDSGLLPNAIEQRYASDLGQRQFIFVESPSILAYFGEIEFPNWLRIVSSEDDVVGLLENDYREAIADEKIFLVESVALIDGNEVYSAIKKRLSEEFTAYGYHRGGLIGASGFARATMRNLPYNVYPIDNFQQSLEGMTALVVGAGPSLDDSIEWIQNNKQNLVVFAAARVAKRLHDANIQVHFFISIDPNLESFFNSRDMLKTEYPSILINASHINPSLLSQWQGGSFYFKSLYPWLEDNKKSIMSIGNTVTHYGLASAVLLGAKAVYLAGVDMCYKGNQTHIGGSHESEVGKYHIAQRSSVKTYRDECAETSLTFDHGRLYLANQVLFCHKNINKNICFYNLSPDAAYVEGIGLWDIEKNLNDEDGFLFRKAYQDLCKKTNVTLLGEKKHIHNVIKEVQSKRVLFSQATKLAQEGVKLAKLANSVEFSGHDKLHKTERKLLSLLCNYHEFFTSLGFLNFERLEILKKKFEQENKNLQDLSSDDLSLFYMTKFHAFLNTLKSIIFLVDEALTNLQKYKRFLEDDLSLEELKALWLCQGDPGLVYRWERYFPEKASLPVNKDQIEDLKKAYHFLLKEAQGDQLDKLKKQANNIVYLISELDRTVVNNDLEELIYLRSAFNNALEGVKDKKNIEQLFDGLSALYRGQQEQAYLLLKNLTFEDRETNLFLHKEKLKLALLFKDKEIIISSYETLSKLSSKFLPAFANYWLMTKVPEKALPLLLSWLSESPQDFEAQLKLLRVWLALTDFFQAKKLFVELKKTHPNNPELAQFEERIKKLELSND